MNVKDIRLSHLRACIQRAGSATAFAASVETSLSYISSIIGPNPTRNVGDDLARRMEKIYGYPPDGPSERALKFAMLVDELSEDDWEEALDFVDRKLLRARKKAEAALSTPAEPPRNNPRKLAKR
jgi:hypothetical protein